MDERDERFAEWDAEFRRTTGKSVAALLDPQQQKQRQRDVRAVKADKEAAFARMLARHQYDAA